MRKVPATISQVATSLILIITLTLTCLGKTPSEVAIQHLKRLSEKKVDLTKDTALSPHCGAFRRKKILQLLEFFVQNNLRIGEHYSLENQKILGDLAGVLIRADHPTAPLSPRVHAIALVKKNNQWIPTPALGSFSNIALGYDEKIEHTAHTLELWLSSEKNKLESYHQSQAAQKLNSNILTTAQKAGLPKKSAEELIEYMLQQCRAHNVIGVLACIKFDQALLEPTLNLVSKGLTNSPPSNNWKLLTTPSVIHVPLHTDHTAKIISIGFYNPLAREKIHLLHFPIEKAHNRFYIKLPPSLENLTSSSSYRRALYRKGDTELKKEFPTTLLSSIPEKACATPRATLDQFLEAHKKRDFRSAVALLPRSGDYFSEPSSYSNTLAHLSDLWKNLHGLHYLPKTKLPILTHQKIAVATLNFSNPSHPTEGQTHHLWMIQDTEGWHIIGEGSLSNLPEPNSLDTLKKQLLEQASKQRDDIALQLLSSAITLTPNTPIQPVDEASAKKVFTQFRKNIRQGNLQAALSSCAVIQGVSPQKTLKLLGYNIRGSKNQTTTDKILGFTTSGKWAALSISNTSPITKLKNYPLYLITQTPKGPRILISLDFRYPTNRGRKLLNQRCIKLLNSSLSPQSAKDINTLFNQHLKIVESSLSH